MQCSNLPLYAYMYDSHTIIHMDKEIIFICRLSSISKRILPQFKTLPLDTPDENTAASYSRLHLMRTVTLSESILATRLDESGLQNNVISKTLNVQIEMQ